MAVINHLYVTFVGGYRTAELAEESWQFGIRFMPTLEAGDVGLVGAPLGHFSTADVDQSDQSTEYDFTTNYILEGGVTDLDPQSLLKDQIGPAAKTFLEHASMFFSDEVILKEITVYPYGNDGKVIKSALEPYKAVATTRVEINGGNTGSMVPPQCALVTTLQTESTGRRGHGRIYLPIMTTGVIGANSVSLGTGVRTTMQGIVNDFIEACCPAEDPTIRPIVIGPPWTQYFTVTKTRMGRAFDTQKRRRKSLAEDYADLALTFA